MPVPAPAPRGGIIRVCVLQSLPDFPRGTTLQFPTVVVGLMTLHSRLRPSLPGATSYPLLVFPGVTSQINYSGILVSGLLLGKPKPSHQVTAGRHNPRGLTDPGSVFQLRHLTLIFSVVVARDLLPLQALDPYFRQEKGENTKSQNGDQNLPHQRFHHFKQEGNAFFRNFCLYVPLLSELCHPPLPQQ